MATQIKNYKLGSVVWIALAILILFSAAPSPAHAQQFGFAQQPCYSNQGGYCLKIIAPKIPQNNQTDTSRRFAATAADCNGKICGLEFLPNTANGDLGGLLTAIYYFLLGLVGISALIMFVWGGIEYMLAGDKDPGKAKERMKNAVYGLVLALTSYLILYTINPDLVSKLNINLNPITPQQRTDGGPPGTSTTTANGGPSPAQCDPGQQAC